MYVYMCIYIPMLYMVGGVCIHMYACTYALCVYMYVMGNKQVNLLLRLSPIVPYNLMNLLIGLTATRLEDYAIGCVIGK